MYFHAKKVTAFKGCSSKTFTRAYGSFLKNSYIIKSVFLLFITFLIVNAAYSQKALKITRMKHVTWDRYTREWSPWPSGWRSYESGSEPILTLYRLDDNGYTFQVSMKTSEGNFSFDVAFAGYDDNNNWSKYKDVNGDEIDISGSTMSKLSLYGWPDSVVQIYLWIYSSNEGFVLE